MNFEKILNTTKDFLSTYYWQIQVALLAFVLVFFIWTIVLGCKKRKLYKTTRAQIDSLVSENIDSTAKINELTKSISEKDDKIKDLTDRYEDIKKSLTETKAILVDKDAQYSTFKSSSEILTKKNTEVEAELETTKNAYDKLSDKVLEMDAKIKSLTKTNTDLQVDLNATKATVLEKTLNINELNRSLEDSKKETKVLYKALSSLGMKLDVEETTKYDLIKDKKEKKTTKKKTSK